MREELKPEIIAVFPYLEKSGGYTTSAEDAVYNCIAHAAGANNDWWWPIQINGRGYWPIQNRNPKIEGFEEMFASLGYQKCELAESAELEIGFEKIAIYVGQNGLPTHAARQQKDGSWTSKLGHWYDIEHSTPEGVQGLIYGTVETIMKRPLQRESETDHEQENHSS